MMQKLRRDDDEAYAEISADMPRRRALAALTFLGHFLVTVIFLGGAVGKIHEFGMSGHWEHFTNWAWTAEGLFFLFTLPAGAVQYGLIRHDSFLGSLTKFVIVVAFVPLYGTASVVSVVVSVLLVTGSPFLTDIFLRIPASLVMLGQDVFHVWPVMFFILFFLIFKPLIYFAHNRVLTHFGVLLSPLRTTAYILYQVYIGSAAFLASYSSVHDPHEVYKTTVWTMWGVAVGFLTLTTGSLIPMLVTLGLLRVGSRTPYATRWLLQNHSDPTHDKKTLRIN